MVELYYNIGQAINELIDEYNLEKSQALLYIIEPNSEKCIVILLMNSSYIFYILYIKYIN